VKTLTGEDPGPVAGTGTPAMPPIDPDTALRGTTTWKLTTSQGEVTIALDPDVAPWHVATIITLTRDRFYDGLFFHRVVPDFVVQGGDPTATGWGGPGFNLPSEPGSALEARPATYDAGAIGIADSGKDTGGSQWFAMHGPAPHLEGRYTRVGAVVEGADVIDRLQIGDKIIRAQIE
jgi:cyclophilin family peptidyl-prolyl cis-trans isomerase